MAAERVRLSLELSKDLNDILETLADQLDATKSEVLKKALILMKVASEEKRKGNSLGVVQDKDDRLVARIVGL
jgi:hypothetical protein